MMFPLPFPQSGCSPYKGASDILKRGCGLEKPHPPLLEEFGAWCGAVAGLHPLSRSGRGSLRSCGRAGVSSAPGSEAGADLHRIYTSPALTLIPQACSARFSTPDILPELNSSSKNRSSNPPAQYFYLQRIQGRNELRIILT